MGGARGAGSGDNEQAGGFRMIRVFAGSRIVQVLELVCISLMQAALAVAVAYCVQQVFDRMLASRADIDPYFAAAITTLLVGSLVAIAILEVRRLTQTDHRRVVDRASTGPRGGRIRRASSAGRRWFVRNLWRRW